MIKYKKGKILIGRLKNIIFVVVSVILFSNNVHGINKISSISDIVLLCKTLKIKVTGTNGTKEIIVRINDFDYKKYKIDFNSGKYEDLKIVDEYSEVMSYVSRDENQVYEDKIEILGNMLNYSESIFERLEV